MESSSNGPRLRRHVPFAESSSSSCCPSKISSTSFSSNEEEQQQQSTVTTTKSTTTKNTNSIPRWRYQSWNILLPRMILALLTVVMVCLLVILVGAHVERRFMDRNYKTVSTLELYTMEDDVCVLVEKHDDNVGVLFETRKASEVVGQQLLKSRVAHCGACGSCSTLQDMQINAQTTRTLTDSATWCSTKGFLYSLFLTRGIEYYKTVARECLQQTVGFTPACLECWVDDMACSIKSCVFTCLKSLYVLREPKNNIKDGSLNKCLECDEKICGPAFVTCAGVNRRRQGIVSDIGRDEHHELCQLVQTN
jgi:hypothetical protein